MTRQTHRSIADSLSIRGCQRRTAQFQARLVVFPLVIVCLGFWIEKNRHEPSGKLISEQLETIKSYENNHNRRLAANSSDIDDLTLIRGIGPATAKNLVRIREYLGPFQATQDLRLVPGIGIKRLPEIEKQLTVEMK